jgi:dTDP-4-amino-4,6-dideoxygalactose transaminase
VFNTFEGGAIICPDRKTKIRIDQLKNFGHAGETNVVAPGINGKMSEFNAALGLLQLKYVDQAIRKRKEIDSAYRNGLARVKGIHCLCDTGELIANYAYFPILIGQEYPLDRDGLYEKMKGNGVHPRRYFYPLISEFPMYRGLASSHRDNLPAATQAASQVLCLPIYPDLPLEKVVEICDFIRAQ